MKKQSPPTGVVSLVLILSPTTRAQIPTRTTRRRKKGRFSLVLLIKKKTVPPALSPLDLLLSLLRSKGVDGVSPRKIYSRVRAATKITRRRTSKKEEEEERNQTQSRKRNPSSNRSARNLSVSVEDVNASSRSIVPFVTVLTLVHPTRPAFLRPSVPIKILS
jgi:hypothetical protein